MKISINFLQADTHVFVGYNQVCLITQNKFVISWSCLTIEGRDKVDYLHASKHQTLLQVDINFYWYDHSR